MAQSTYEGKIYTKAGGNFITVRVEANDLNQAKKLIELRPEFKSWMQQPRKIS